MEDEATIQLRDICRCLDVRDRDARYVMERGFVPKGVYVKPASGNHRQFSGGQAFWLGMVLKLKAVGIKTPLAAKISDYAARSVQTTTQSLCWESPFLPSQGKLETKYEYWVDVGDLKYIRFGTNAEPSSDGKPYYFSWHAVNKPGVPVKDLAPCVILRLDISQICRRLSRAFNTLAHDASS